MLSNFSNLKAGVEITLSATGIIVTTFKLLILLVSNSLKLLFVNAVSICLALSPLKLKNINPSLFSIIPLLSIIIFVGSIIKYNTQLFPTFPEDNPQIISENVENQAEIESKEEINDENVIDISSEETKVETVTEIKNENAVETKKKENSTVVKEQQNSKISTPTPQTTKTTETPTIKKQQEKNTVVEVTPPQNNTPIKEEVVQPAPKQDPVVEEKKPVGEEYKQNDAMINTIKSIINSNKSEDMIEYGYEIVVDSSIVNATSQFTYTQQRVIDKIKWKFGTIRIYARDYYSNGQYICTQCYII